MRSHTPGRQSRRPAISHYLETHADYTARLNEAVDPGYDEPGDNDDDDEDDDDPADQGMAEFRQAIRAREEAEQRAAAASATLS